MLCPVSARAQGGEAPLEIHGFVSQGAMMTTDNNYLTDSERGSFEFNEVGVNLTKGLGDRLRVGMQLFMRDLGPIGDYQPNFDWFYLDYRFWDWLGMRAGRTKLPFGLYNENSDVDAARVPVLLPQSIYPTTSREFLLAQTGLELYGSVPIGGAGDLEYRAYGGTIFLDTSDADPGIRDFSVRYIVGGRLMWQTPLDGLQVGGSVQALRLDLDYAPPPEVLMARGIDPATYVGPVSLRYPIVLGLASIEYSANDLLISAEYGRARADLESSDTRIFPSITQTNEAFYGMVSYRVAPWFTPGVYYAVLFPDVDDREGSEFVPNTMERRGRSAYRHDVAATLRYDITDHWLVKLEAHYMHGTANLETALNGGVPAHRLTTDWGLFMVKTTAYF